MTTKPIASSDLALDLIDTVQMYEAAIDINGNPCLQLSKTAYYQPEGQYKKIAEFCALNYEHAKKIWTAILDNYNLTFEERLALRENGSPITSTGSN